MPSVDRPPSCLQTSAYLGSSYIAEKSAYLQRSRAATTLFLVREVVRHGPSWRASTTLYELWLIDRRKCALHRVSKPRSRLTALRNGRTIGSNRPRKWTFHPAKSAMPKKQPSKPKRTRPTKRVRPLTAHPESKEGEKGAASEKGDVAGATSNLTSRWSSVGPAQLTGHEFLSIQAGLTARTGLFDECAPLIPGDWSWIDPTTAAEIIASLMAYMPELSSGPVREMVFSRGIMALRHRALAFYGQGMDMFLLEAIGSTVVGDLAALNFLVHKEGFHLIDGVGRGIHQLNRMASLSLKGSADAADYLCFFSSALNNTEGRFRILHTAEDVTPLASREHKQAADMLKAVVHPPRLKKDGAKGWLFDACLAYGTALFKAQMLVDRKGQVEMSREEVIDLPAPLVAEQRRGIIRILPRFRLPN